MTQGLVETLEELLHSDPDSSTASHTEEMDDFRQRATEELTSVEAEVAAHSEVFLRFASESAAKATLGQAEYRDAVTHATSAAEDRYQTEFHRERQAHWYAREMQYPDADTNVTYYLDLALPGPGERAHAGTDVERDRDERPIRLQSSVGRTTQVRSSRD